VSEGHFIAYTRVVKFTYNALYTASWKHAALAQRYMSVPVCSRKSLEYPGTRLCCSCTVTFCLGMASPHLRFATCTVVSRTVHALVAM
jgi:hypothetical protein